jgi:N-acetyl sugar amidotransferase
MTDQGNNTKLEAYYGLPKVVEFCRKCVISNQRPSSAVEFKHTSKSRKKTIHFEDGVCDACRVAEEKDKIDWEERERELVKLLDRYRRNDGGYDCLVPGSGGKDSVIQAHILKHKYGMNPLTVTWPPILYTDYGHRNFLRWCDHFDNITVRPNRRTMRTLTRLAIENIFHPFQTFILGQKNMAPKLAAQHGIELVFYGENEAEYGNPIADNRSSLRDKSYYAHNNVDDLFLAGVSVKELREKHDLRLQDLKAFLPATDADLGNVDVAVHYLGYYMRWIPQEAYYYAVEHTGFEARPFRTEGTYSKYNSIDDKIDDLHYYATYIKFGLGRATYDASQEVRNGHITREEAVALVRRFDGEVPTRYFDEVMDYLEMDGDYFLGELTDRFRSPHLWVKDLANNWTLRHSVFSEDEAFNQKVANI